MDESIKHINPDIASVFRPDNGNDSFVKSDKPKRKIESRESLSIHWPHTRKDQERVFWTWHSVAMHIAEKEECDLRVLAVLHKFIFWQNGTINATNKQMAAQAGQCSAKTIQRCAAKMIALGLLRSIMKYNRETQKTERLLLMSYPKKIPETVVIGDDDD